MSGEKDRIDAKILKDNSYLKLVNMSIEQKETIVKRKQAEISKAFIAMGKYAYGDQLKTVFKSSSYLVIEKLILDKFSNKSIASYIKEVFTDDKLSKLSQASLESYISKLRKGLEHSRLLIKAYNEDKKIGKSYENRLEKAVNEVESISKLVNLQEERILQMRNKEKEDGEFDKEIKREIDVQIKLLKTSSDLKEIMGVNQIANKNPIEELRGRISSDFSRILDRDSAKKVRNIISMLTSMPHDSNIISEKEAEKIKPINASDVISLKEAQKEYNDGKYNNEDVFFDIPRKHSTLLSLGIRDSADTILNDKEKLKNKYAIRDDKIIPKEKENTDDELLENTDDEDFVESEIEDDFDNDLNDFE